MSDYRFYYKADFDLTHAKPSEGDQLEYVLQAIKPSRILNVPIYDGKDFV
jgi:hypothetical protein